MQTTTTVHLPLKNTAQTATIDRHVYQALLAMPRLQQMGFLDNLRLHSSGCVVFQKARRCEEAGGYRTETIYLHKLIAERYLADTRTPERKLVGCRNGNKLDCRLANLEYRSRSTSSRKRRSSSKVGYTGVYRENNRYRAVISVNRRSVHIGMFATAEEAARAYNQRSIELYGAAGKVNHIAEPQPPDSLDVAPGTGDFSFADRTR